MARTRWIAQGGTRRCQLDQNVWPVPSASSFVDPIWAVCINVSGLRADLAKMEIRASRT